MPTEECWHNPSMDIWGFEDWTNRDECIVMENILDFIIIID